MADTPEALPGGSTDPQKPDPGYLRFEHEFKKLTGIQLHLYKEKQMKRRINTLIDRKHLSGYDEFLTLLRTSPAELDAFTDYITINVTEFFRTPEHWNCMTADVLPDLLGRKDKLKIWSTACATGEESYSLAMSLLKQTDASRFHILATDIDGKVIGFARKGLYSTKTTENLSEDVRSRFFVKTKAGMQVSEEVKACVDFQQMDLLKDPYPVDCDLIVCRNVLIYFTEEAKDLLYSQFKESLAPGGWLFTGNTEQIIYYKKYGFQKVTGFLYKNE